MKIAVLLFLLLGGCYYSGSSYYSGNHWHYGQQSYPFKYRYYGYPFYSGFSHKRSYLGTRKSHSRSFGVKPRHGKRSFGVRPRGHNTIIGRNFGGYGAPHGRGRR